VRLGTVGAASTGHLVRPENGTIVVHPRRESTAVGRYLVK
jgi:hypothetical protein